MDVNLATVHLKRTLPSPHVKVQAPSTNPTCLVDGSEPKVLSSSATYNTRCSPSSLHPQPNSPKGLRITTTIASTSVPPRRVIRPLPAIPSPSSASHFHFHSPSTPLSSRPLPTPPCTSPLSATLFKESCAIPAAEKPEPALAAISDPVACGLPMKHDLAPAVPTSIDAVTPEPPDGIGVMQPSTNLSNTKSGPHRRSATTSDIPRLDEPELEGDPPLTGVTLSSAHGNAPGVDSIHEQFDRLAQAMRTRTATTVGKILDLCPPDDESSQDEDDIDDSEEALDQEYFDPTRMPEKIALPLKARFSCHWLREKRGHRWEESDYQSILRELRTL